MTRLDKIEDDGDSDSHEGAKDERCRTMWTTGDGGRTIEKVRTIETYGSFKMTEIQRATSIDELSERFSF